MWLICAWASYAVITGDGWTRLVGMAWLAGWFVRHTVTKGRRQGWRPALVGGSGLMFAAGFFAATFADPVWMKGLGWGGLFVGVWFLSALGYHRRQQSGYGAR